MLVLAACALAVANAGSAAVRSRATELGVLACLGWPRRALFALMLGEAAGTGLVAGVAGTALALGAGPLLGVGLRAGPVELAAPVALLLSLAAGLLPAWQATRADPGVAVRPAVARVRRAGNPHRVSGLALGNLLRRPGRTLLGTLSLALGVAALTLLAVVDLTFRGTVAGTLLGDAVTVQVQGGDYVAAAITALLGAATVADVLYIAIDERSAEYALLSATGWTDRLLATLVGYEALGLGLVGAVTGAAAAVGIAAVIDAPWRTALLLSASVGAGGTLLALLAAVLPLRALRRLPTARLLAEE
ncbi:FtsX-like permease family protein [Streptacidiphilus sp. N1-3]|uniref:FtsX-like permease family protein n=1 Tax=Streptacidiphilus alkalitolerans TaxID=3342712 RepID=A0ABV6X768_9ACTN